MPLLRVGLDLGTGYSGIAVQRLQEDATSKPANITVVPPKDGYASPPNAFKQVSVYHNDILYCGKDVEGILSANPELQDKVMELNKLALHPLFDDVAEVVHVKQVLPARDRAALQGFFADLLRYFIGEIRDFMKREYPLVEGRESTDYWNDISLEFQISVPAMWGDSQRGVLRNAAKHAGVAKVELREEALCVAIDYILYRIERDQIWTSLQSSWFKYSPQNTTWSFSASDCVPEMVPALTRLIHSCGLGFSAANVPKLVTLRMNA
jgi:hypothetical protein